MSSVRILVVDDELDCARTNKRDLEALEFVVVGMASNASDAIKLTHQERPDLVMIDTRMPGPNGVQAAELIWKLYDTPVLFLTAHGDRMDSLRAGAFGYLSKGAQQETLRTAIEAALYNYDTLNVRTREYHFAIDPSGRLLSQSKSAEKLTGYSTDEFLGRNFDELLTPQSRKLSAYLLKRVLNERKSFGGQIDIVIKNGQTVSMEADYSPVCLNGELEGISINAWKKPTSSSDEWADTNRRRLELIDKKYSDGLNEAEKCELEELQEAADGRVGLLEGIDQERLEELQIIYDTLTGKQRDGRSEV